MLLVFGGLSVFLILMAGGPQAFEGRDAFVSILPVLFLIFMATGTAGYLVSRLTGRRRRGRAFECVQYFYMFGLSFLVIVPALLLPRWAGWQPLTVIWCLIVASLTGALLLTISDRRKAT